MCGLTCDHFLSRIRDLKAENVLQHSRGDWVLCDFGSTTNKEAVYTSSDQVLMGEETIRKYTTPAYRAPEVQWFTYGISHSTGAALTFCCMQMWDLYSREVINGKADIWVRRLSRA